MSLRKMPAKNSIEAEDGIYQNIPAFGRSGLPESIPPDLRPEDSGSLRSPDDVSFHLRKALEEKRKVS